LRGGTNKECGRFGKVCSKADDNRREQGLKSNSKSNRKGKNKGKSTSTNKNKSENESKNKSKNKNKNENIDKRKYKCVWYRRQER
jgi:hypothetical protein